MVYVDDEVEMGEEIGTEDESFNISYASKMCNKVQLVWLARVREHVPYVSCYGGSFVIE